MREGPAAPDFEAVDVLPTITAKAVEYIGARAKEGKPFFMYFPLNAPHAPLVPSNEFVGKSGISPYADFVLQVDWTVGQVLEALERSDVAKDTLVIFTSDNGFSPAGNLKLQLDHGHNPNYVFRGTKADIFEGGHHIPFVARWPGRVKTGSTCAGVICLNDLMGTAAEIVGAKIPDDAAEDSVSMLGDLLGTATKPVREATVHASIDGSLAIRQGKQPEDDQRACGIAGGSALRHDAGRRRAAQSGGGANGSGRSTDGPVAGVYRSGAEHAWDGADE